MSFVRMHLHMFAIADSREGSDQDDGGRELLTGNTTPRADTGDSGGALELPEDDSGGDEEAPER